MPEPDGVPNCPRCQAPLRSGRLLGLCPRCVGRVAFGIAGTGAPLGPAVDRPPLLRLGPYELTEELGRGAMGAVYRARDPGLGRDVAVKVILSGQFASETERRRFLSEAGHAAGLDHPNIVPIHQSGETDGRAWFAMKLVEGRTLAELVLAGTFPPSGPGRFDRIAALVAVLETVRQDPERHPEGDVLEHSLQVFDLVHQERPFDEELLTAALVHDLGRAIDRAEPVAAGVSALGDLITERTRWLVESLEAATAHGNQTLGMRARQRLESHADVLDVLLLAECDRKACIRGYDAVSLDEAIAILRELVDADQDA